MEINAKMVGELRESTGAGLMDCKKALVESEGNVDKAVEILRKKGAATAAKKATREASEGLVNSYIHLGGKVGVLVEVNCESDFVAKTDDFKDFVRDIAMHVAATNPVCVSREEIDLSSKDSNNKKENLRFTGSIIDLKSSNSPHRLITTLDKPLPSLQKLMSVTNNELSPLPIISASTSYGCSVLMPFSFSA